MQAPEDGILLVDKQEGETSHAVVQKIRKVMNLGKRYKVGHAGTLDPFATGLLVILLGQGAKLSRYIMEGEKEYLATLELGIETDTLDPTGKVLATRNVPDLCIDFIRERAERFEGQIRQKVPVYSAVKYQGRRSYQLARQGLPITPKERKVTVHSVSILSVDLPFIEMRIRCGSGTYIRSLAADLAKDLGTVGRLGALRRLRSGGFDVKMAVSSNRVDTGLESCREMILRRRVPLKDALPQMKEIELDDILAEKVQQGYQPFKDELPSDLADGATFGQIRHSEAFIKMVRHDKLLAIAKYNDGEGDGYEKVKLVRVFS